MLSTDVQHYLCPYMYEPQGYSIACLLVASLTWSTTVESLTVDSNESKVLHVMPCKLRMKTFREDQQYMEKANCIGSRPTVHNSCVLLLVHVHVHVSCQGRCIHTCMCEVGPAHKVILFVITNANSKWAWANLHV